MSRPDAPDDGAFTVTSWDGTSIACTVSGAGPPIVLVHGTTGSDFSWALIRPFLEDRFAVFAMQRRGRGLSGDGADYSLEREAEDVAAVVDSIGEPVRLVGHSFGADCCLEAIQLTGNVDRLVLYEPAFDWPLDASSLARVDALVVSGDDDGATATYLREAAGLSQEELATLRSSPTWDQRVAAAHTFGREDRVAAAYAIAPGRFAGLTLPILLLSGSDSHPEFRRSIDKVMAAIPHATPHVLDGEGHAANVTAPELLAAEISAF